MEKGWLEERIQDISALVKSALLKKIMEEIVELIPDIASALADGRITDEEAKHLEARLVQQLVAIFGKDISKESADKIIGGATEIYKLLAR